MGPRRDSMITLIAALTKDHVIGFAGKIPWNIPQDLEHFKKTTLGSTVIMGRKTWQSIPAVKRPLPHRHNIIVSRSMPTQEGIDVCRNITQAIEKAQGYGKEIFIIGGANIYALALPFATKMLLSHINKGYEGDIYFPKFNKEEWDIINQTKFEGFTLKEYRRKRE